MQGPLKAHGCSTEAPMTAMTYIRKTEIIKVGVSKALRTENGYQERCFFGGGGVAFQQQ